MPIQAAYHGPANHKGAFEALRRDLGPHGFGAPASMLSASQDADLLVLGHSGRGGFTSVLLGSVGLQCVLRAVCAVTIVRPVVARAKPEAVTRARLPRRRRCEGRGRATDDGPRRHGHLLRSDAEIRTEVVDEVLGPDRPALLRFGLSHGPSLGRPGHSSPGAG